MKAMLVGISAALLLGAASGAVWGQTCRDDIPASAPDGRFTDNGDYTVTDLATGLTWKQCAEGLSGTGCATGAPATFTWQAALQHAEAAVFAGRADWRPPNKNELASLVEPRCYDPAINLRWFPSTPSTWFWSSSPYAGYPGSAWSVDFYGGYVDGNFRGDADHVRLVRGGQ